MPLKWGIIIKTKHMKYKPVTWQINGITYTAKSTYVDIDTGEIINRSKALDKEKYIIIKTIKTNEHGTTYRTIEYTKQCRKQPQQRISFPD